MAVVRYVALLALVVWLGGALHALAGDTYRRLDLLACACGAVMLVSLLVMKFVGPPPRAFPLRTGLVVLMLAATGLASVGGPPRPLQLLNVVLALVLLSWYAHE